MDKICALIRQTWYEAAKKNLQEIDRLRFYEACLEYEFYGNAPVGLPMAVQVLFDVIVNDIDRDREKTAARAERNRINGMKGGRPPKSNITQQDTKTQMVFSVSEKKPITLHNTTTYNTTQQVVSNTTEDTHTRFFILLDFFERGVASPSEELERFWNYYAAQGWQTKNGAQVIDKQALARVWKPAALSAQLMKSRALWAQLVRKTGENSDTTFITDYIGCKQDGRELMITMKSEVIPQLLETQYITVLRDFVKSLPGGDRLTVKYYIAGC